MQREHISIPKLIAYVLFSVIIFALQTGTFGSRAARRPDGGGCCRLDGRHLL